MDSQHLNECETRDFQMSLDIIHGKMNCNHRLTNLQVPWSMLVVDY